MKFSLLSPIIIPILMAFVGYAIGRKNKNIRNVVVVAVALFEFIAFLSQFAGFMAGTITDYELVLPKACGLGISLKMDGFRALYTTVASFMWLVCSAFSLEYNAHHKNRNRYYMFLLWTMGATMGVFLSADLATTFLFFEMASLTSYTWVVQEETKGALKAAETYLAVAVIGGLVMVMGLVLLYDVTGTLVISELREVCRANAGNKELVAAGMCIFWGFAAKAGAVPLHIWLPKAHPVAPAPASALLSGMLTKVGIFGVLVVSTQIFYGDPKWGSFVLIVGALTMFIGALLAVFSIDMKRTLACSSVSQIGFILIGVSMQCMLGEENALAVRGTLLYMVNHSLFKLVLFLVAGVVFMNIHALDFNVIKGFGRKKPLLKFIYLCAGLGIAGIPLFSGYVSKTLVHEAMVEYMELLHEGEAIPVLFSAGGIKAFEWLFLLSGGMTLAYMTKLFFVVFVEKNADEELQKKYDEKKKYMNLGNSVLLTSAASLFIIFGVFANQVFDKIADMGQAFMGLDGFEEKISYFSLTNLKGSAVSIIIGILLYILVIRTVFRKKDGTYVNLWPDWLDLENLVYRPLLNVIVNYVFMFVSRVCDKLMDSLVMGLRKTIYRDSPIPVELTEGNSVTHAAGSLFDGVKSIFKKEEVEPDKTYKHKFAMIFERINEDSIIIIRSLSFGLIFFCVGLVLTLIYMLWMK